MEIIQHFQGTLNHGFQGNIVYHFRLPENCQTLSIHLIYDKEYDDEQETYMEELRPIYESYKGGPVSQMELRNAMDSMKTELQLALIIQDEFVGNVHMTGTKKEIYLSKETSSRGCLFCPDLEGMAKIIVNVFQVLKDQTSYDLIIKGDFKHVEANGTA